MFDKNFKYICSWGDVQYVPMTFFKDGSINIGSGAKGVSFYENTAIERQIFNWLKRGE